MSLSPEWASADGADARSLRQPLAALERGDWRAAYALVTVLSREVGADAGAPEVAPLLAAVRMVARSMLMRTHGQVGKSWSALAQAAALCRPTQPGVAHLQPADPAVLFLLPTLRTNELWGHLLLIGRREEQEMRSQRGRLLKAAQSHVPGNQAGGERLTARQQALIEGVIDHLAWVDCDPGTWQAPTPDERVAPSEDLTRSGLGDLGRNYFLRRATVLYQSVFPRESGINRLVWDQMRGYREVRARALQELAKRKDDVPPVGVLHRIGYARALQDASLWSQCVMGGKMS